MDIEKMNRLARIGYEDFRRMARDTSLNQYEKIGAHEAFRRGKEEAIFQDILAKLPLLADRGKRVIDIGTGCSDLPRMLVEWCAARQDRLVLMDSEEMLALLPQAEGVEKVAARFPDCEEFIGTGAGSFDVVLVYSVIHYVFQEANIWDFVDSALNLLAPGGMMLIGDIPNVSKRKRFFSSEAGVRFHQGFMNTKDLPQVEFNRLEAGHIDDSVVFGLVARARAQGFDAYIVPQPPALPMANRREDVLVVRP